MDLWIAKAVILAAGVAMVAIRAPHGARSRGLEVARSRKGRREVILLTFAWVGYVLPLIWALSPALSFADYSLRTGALLVGTVCLAAGLWIFHRSHVDLGTNWSVTLEIRKSHQLVTHGVYKSVRHPMYSALLLYALGQALAVPNWVAGPSYLIVMAILFVFRVGVEEQMMLETFGDEYATYMAKTKRLVPGTW